MRLHHKGLEEIILKPPIYEPTGKAKEYGDLDVGGK